jgi:hypothetical protein
MNLKKFKPAVDKKILYFIAGIVWLSVGIMLNIKAYHFSGTTKYLFSSIGIIIGVFIAIFGFSKVANKNIKRIKQTEGKRCLFSFIPWKSYLLIIFMIFLGFSLRRLGLPKRYLTILYNAIGTGLFLASFRYFKEVV